MRHVALGSTSPAKVMAVEAALRRVHGRFVAVTHVATPSGVPAQPVGDDETYAGALNRARGALALVPGAQLGVGIEAGVSDAGGEHGGGGASAGLSGRGGLYTSAWVVVTDRAGRLGSARSATFAVPTFLAERVSAGQELGTALDAAYGLERAKDGPGAAGVLTRGLVSRSELYVQAVLLALVPWLAPEPRGV
jgi:inosine/xanthosine triphosphatase